MIVKKIVKFFLSASFLITLVLFLGRPENSNANSEIFTYDTARALLIGQVPEVIIWNINAIDDLAEFIDKIAGTVMPRVTIYFVPFGEEEHSAIDLLRLQRLWLKEFLSDKPEERLSKNTLGFHYDHTDIIQLAPRIFANHFTGNPTGGKPIVVGAGFYVLGHELMHFAFEQKGVPGRLHHCSVFIDKGYSERLADYLSGHGLANLTIVNLKYIQAERDNCKSPSPD